jgi:adenylate kinase family enzyme
VKIGPRVVVVGTSGSGKSTFAAQLARAMWATHIELDAFKHGPNWTERNEEELRRLTAAAVEATGTWVVDGNYSEVRDLVWPRATTLVWLDYSKPLVMARVVRRSVTRVVFRQELFNGNRSDWRMWGDSEHPIRWAWSTHAANRERYQRLTALPEWSHLDVVRLRRPREAKALLSLNG